MTDALSAPAPASAQSDTDKQGLSRLAKFEDCASAVDGLFQQALRTSGPSAFDEFLNFVRSFNSLSVYNAMLVRVQRPGAAAVASRRQWRERGRTVLPDAAELDLPLATYAKGFGTATVPPNDNGWRYHPVLGFAIKR